MTTDGGGWTVIHKSYGENVNFHRKWVECENGFGDINGQFRFENQLRFHNGKKFTTFDNDPCSKNCALLNRGSWWYYTYNSCDLTSSGKVKPIWGHINPVVKSVMMLRKS
ncbi:Hypothetical predicted protein [Mytilus galloprovincialis]|uniref:Fibrinogen C-terminal domain-containing protein n=1 Tax=Mytilus galloprovincialis TaxID=29158 RepID=A0A8B6GBP2_MYTGA|nr:Hypothetical predicted protein [Mytilus galloprovincialis]